MARINSSAGGRETAQEIAAGRLAAGKNLFYLFGGTDATGQVYDGVLHQYSLSALLADPGWKGYLEGVRRDPNAKTLAVVSSSRNDPKFPPALVAGLFSDAEKDQDSRWFSEVFLTGAAEIHAATGKGLILPVNHSSLDLVRSAFNLVDHLDEAERKQLGFFMPDEAPRRELATTLAGILDEAKKAVDEPGLTAAQRLFRWAVRKWEEREDDADERRRERAARAKESGAVNPATILPPAPGAVQQALLPSPPPATAGPILPPAPTAAEPQVPAVAPAEAIVPAAPPTASLPNGKDVEQELVFEALMASGPAGKAMVSLVRQGKKTFEDATTYASQRGLF